MSSDVPASASSEMRRLLIEHIFSVEGLDLLVLLVRSAAAMSEDELAKKLELPPSSVAEAAEQLRHHGLVERTADQSLRRAASPKLDRALADLVKTYDDDRGLILGLLANAAFARNRTSADTFADAFRFRPRHRRKGDDDG